VFHTVVHWHKLGDVVNECTVRNNIVLAIFVPEIIKFGGNLTKLCQKNNFDCFFETLGICVC